MAKVIIKVVESLDKCGDSFLDQRTFDIEFDLDSSNEFWVNCTIDGRENCGIRKEDLKQLIAVIRI